MPSGNKPSCKALLTKVYVAICRHKATLKRKLVVSRLDPTNVWSKAQETKNGHCIVDVFALRVDNSLVKTTAISKITDAFLL